MRAIADPYSPGRPPLGKCAAWIIPIFGILWAIGDIAGSSVLLTSSILAAGIVTLMASWWLSYRHWQTNSELPALLRKNLASLLRTELPPGSLTTTGHSFGTFLKPGRPKKIIIKAAGLPPLEGDTAKRLLHIAGEISETAFTLDTKKSAPGKRIVLRLKVQEKEVQLTPRQAVEKAILQGTRDVFPKYDPKVVCTWEESGEEGDKTEYLLDVAITNVNGMELSLSGKRRQILVKLRSRLPKGNFTSDIDPSQDAIYFHRSKPLPAVAVPPREHAPLLVDHKAYSSFNVPLGIGDNGELAIWHPKKDAHLLIIGGTGGGKTIAEHGVIQRLTQAGWRVWLVDGKRIEFIGYRKWSNIELLAQKVDHQIRVLKLAHETMEARYDLIERGLVRIEDLDPIAVVVDELTSLLMAVERRYQETKMKGMPSKDPVRSWAADIARLGRSAKMHLVLGLQRPDANIMGGEMRDNFGGRISLGKLQSKEASMMMWDDPAIGVSVPNIKGRAVSWVNGHLGMIQGTFTANPDPNHDDYHAGMVEAMRPTVEAYSRKSIAEAQPSEDSEDSELNWKDILQASILDDSGNPIEFDPVSSEESKTLRREHTTEPPTDANTQLQTADTFMAALALFHYDPLKKLVYGKAMARKLSALAEKIQPQEEETLEQQAVAPHTLSGISTENLGQGRTIELRYVEPGQNIVVDELGGDEITVSSCEPDDEDPETYYLTGYTTEGEAISAELPADTTVEAFELENV